MLSLKRLPVALILLLACNVFAQPSRQFTLDSLAGQIIRNARLNQQEKSFITSDRSVYKAGENIWLRAFVLQSLSQKISIQSKSLIVDLVNENDSIIRQILFNAGAQQLSGKLVTDIFMPSGFYWLRVYTPDVTVQPAAIIYSKPLYFVNPSLPDKNLRQSSNGNIPSQSNTPQLTFFPEGGSVITGALSAVAFYAVNPAGEPVALTGMIKDNRDSIVTSITSDNSGMGRFEFFPYRARKYTAVIDHGGKEYSFALPSHNFFAGQLSLVPSPVGMKKVRVLLEDSIYRKDYVTYIIGISKDSLCFAGIGRGNYEVSIPEKQFPRGIATLILVNEKGKPLSERSFYVRNSNPEISAATDKLNYRKREKGLLSIAISGANNRPMPASVAVTFADARMLETQPVESIVAQYFQQPGEPLMASWMLAASEALTDTVMDLLMMAKSPSYRKFDAHTNTVINVDDSLLFIRGQVFNSAGQPVNNKVVTLFAQGQAKIFETATTNAEGKFFFPLTEYGDSTKFNVQVGNGNGKAENLTVMIDHLRLPKPDQYVAKQRFAIPASTINYLSRTETNTLPAQDEETTTGKGKTNTSLQDYIEKKRISPSSHIIPGTAFDKGGEGNLRNAIMRVPGMSLLKGFLVIRGHSSQNDPSVLSEPLVVMNGLAMQLPEGDFTSSSPVLNFLNSINTDDIDYIEILKGAEGATFGVRGANGVILVNTSTSVKEAPNNNAPVKSFYARGYQHPALFQSPQYDNKQVKTTAVQDPRVTHYWVGNMITDVAGKLEIPFYTSDVAGTYKVVIKGITEKGDIIHKSFTYTVQ